MPDPSDEKDELFVRSEPLRWVVVHTRPRCEKKLTDAASREGMPTYLPLQTRTHRYGKRRRTFRLPLFSGYTFCCADPVQRQWLQQNQHVANVLAVPDEARLMEQLRQVRAALSAGALIELMPYLETGHRVRIASGPLRGVEGTVVRIQGRTRVLLTIDMIQQAAAVEMDSSLLTPL
ncbi:MAG: hypothetical protein J5I99_04970 [Verrucomicrobia bacterium]|nr:hypothetical protein [Verrucomicrobiota bacterium]